MTGGKFYYRILFNGCEYKVQERKTSFWSWVRRERTLVWKDVKWDSIYFPDARQFAIYSFAYDEAKRQARKEYQHLLRKHGTWKVVDGKRKELRPVVVFQKPGEEERHEMVED